MKYKILVLSALFFIHICFLSSAYSQVLNVATYNIRNENKDDVINGNGWKQRCPVIAKLIRFHDFDIFGAQEVLYGQLNDLLAELKDYSYTGVGRDDGIKAGEFSPVFYKKDKFQVLQSGHFWMSEIEDKPNTGWDAALPRICTWCRFRFKENNRTFWFFNLHMDHIGVKARFESSKLVIRKIQMMCGDEPVILTGDFNVDQNSEGYKYIIGSGILKDTFDNSDLCYAMNGTFNNFNTRIKTKSRIDHVFINNGFHAERYGVLTDTYFDSIPKLPSDHYPVEVFVRFVH
jgi:endonuclease/exonuclease/phosphatase family metal-dependent hydrolase